MSTPSLAAVIPVWNLPDHLSTVLREIAATGIFTQVIVADDASDPETTCDPFALGFTSEELDLELIHQPSEVRGGAGHARNNGLKAVTANNVVFLDADDTVLPSIRTAWELHLQGDKDVERPDFTIYRHADSRVLNTTGQMASFIKDEDEWDVAVGDSPSRLLNKTGAARLCGISAYPWNKIYRTDFLRKHNITCSETPVHNDIKLHWLSFMYARNIIAVREPGVIHNVAEKGEHHLTNKSGRERFCLFDILDDIEAHMHGISDPVRFHAQYMVLVNDLLRWCFYQISADLRPEFYDRAREKFLSFSEEAYDNLATYWPDKAQSMANFMATNILDFE